MTAALLSSTPCVGAVELIAKIGAANSKRRTCAVIFSFLPYALQSGKAYSDQVGRQSLSSSGARARRSRPSLRLPRDDDALELVEAERDQESDNHTDENDIDTLPQHDAVLLPPRAQR